MDAWLSSQHRLWNWASFGKPLYVKTKVFIPTEEQLKIAMRAEAKRLDTRIRERR